MTYLEPARTVIEKLGGYERVAAIVGRHPTRVYRWMRPVSAGGTGGLVPAKYQVVLMDYARDHGICLKATDFFCQRPKGRREHVAA
jgi:hypothetical protein